ncbi:MAG: sodium/glutamate symporter [candidate division KSB1 bacterium]|nr:sodium/glutamate symporter [candidate division KSB1 bacterium]MDZ7304991.1 sodium/glutamate symporter [candidate division KSB1 bacterium]MDZ7314034.1 sodium/glutamate symporter [candidate division KSB1 bacterium]
MFKLDLIQTVAFAGAALFIGYGIRHVVPLVARYNIPAPVIGGLIIAALNLIARRCNLALFQFDTTLQTPFMIAFFTSIGFSASFSLLKVGGPQVVLFLIIATVIAIVQNLVGIAVAIPLDLHPLFGVISGSLTLAGGPATGLAFAPMFEQAGVTGAGTLALSAAMVGIISAGLVGGPVATHLIERHRLQAAITPTKSSAVTKAIDILQKQTEPVPAGNQQSSFVLMKSLIIILVAMGMGAWVGNGFAAMGIKLPAYIGAMIVAAILRNLDDLTDLLRLPHRIIEDIGSVALSLFIVMALMTLKLWELAGLALPLLMILAVQVAVIAVICLWPVFQLMGRDYESAVIVSGFCGFMLGTTANAMANMEALVEHYGPAPRAFLVVPMVGAFFIDFTNAVILTICLNIWK